MKHLKIILAATTASACFAANFAGPLATKAAAQEITSGVQGRVTDQTGKAIAGATVVVRDTRTGAERTLTTNQDGAFAASGLVTGGPYQVTTTAPGLEGQTLEDVTLTLAGATNLVFSLAPSDSGQVITVTGSRVQISQSSVGPGTSFSAAILANAPSFNRDIRDVIRIDPRVSLDRDDGGSGQDRISCLGGNDRGNAFTVDGIPQNDIYGLNDTGFSSRSSTPLPYDAVRETQVQFAPFDVDYGQFTGCAINVVTKSGTNRFGFGGFFEYSDSDMRAKSYSDRGTRRNVAAIQAEKRWGGYFSGPIIKDRLFVFGAYEHHETGQSQDDGPVGAGYPIEQTGITLAQFNEIRDVIKSTYGIDTGDLVTSRPYKNDRYFLRADLQITDKHRLEGTFQHLKESTMRPDDLFTGNSPQAIGQNTFFLSGTKSYYYSGRLYSQWSDAFSTEFRYARSRIRDLQDPIGGGEAQSGSPITRIIVGIDNPTGIDGAVLAGPGINRSGNDLRTRINQYRAVGKVVLGGHQLKFGIEANNAQLYNLFVANATGTLAFRNIADLRAGLLSPGVVPSGANPPCSSVTQTTTSINLVNGCTTGAFGNFSATGDVNDAAAEFSRTIYSAYIQDNWAATDRLDLTAGVRFDWYDGSRPTHNANFAARYGITNSTGFSNIAGVLLPRFGFSYKAGDFGPLSRTTLRGGVGMFSGGDPLVWFGNVFQNDGATFAQGTSAAAACGTGQIDVVVNGVFTGIPACVRTAGQTDAARSEGNTQSLDPALKMPTVLRANFGIQSTLSFADSGFLSNWNINLDYIYSKYRNPLGVVDLAQAINPIRGLNGRTIDGRPIYNSINLTAAGCTGRLTDPGSPPVYTGLTAACFTGTRGGELMLTNEGSYRSHIASFLLSKTINRGLFTEGGSTYLTFGYAYTDAHDRRSMYDNTAGSLYGRLAAFDRQSPGVTTGFFQSRHNITFSANFRNEFFKDLGTSFGLTYVGRSGRPYSLTFTGNNVFNTTNGGLTVSDNALAYIPNGINDPNIVWASNVSTADRERLINFVNTNGCAKKYLGRTIPRNVCNNNWFNDLDLSFSQELPGPGRLVGRNDKIKLYAMFDNFLNLLDSGSNIQRRRNFYGVQDIATVTAPDPQGRYVISSTSGVSTYDSDNVVNITSSIWRIKVGVSYNF